MTCPPPGVREKKNDAEKWWPEPYWEDGHINQILEIQMYPVSQTQRELVFKNTTRFEKWWPVRFEKWWPEF